MGTTWTIFTRECRAYFNSLTAYIFLLIFVLVSGILFFDVGNFFVEGMADMRMFFGFVPWVLLVFVPAIAMRLWAEERKVGTVELLMTLPVRDLEAVLAKYFASLLVLMLAIVLTLPIPYVVNSLADPATGVDWGPIICGYIGIFLMGAAYLAIGMFISSLTSNQILAFIGGVVVSFALFLIGLGPVLSRLPSALVPIASYLGFSSHMMNISRGILDSRDIVYFLSVIIFFIFLTVRSVEGRKWR
jgi:ABC-2 type transport system permease protein